MGFSVTLLLVLPSQWSKQEVFLLPNAEAPQSIEIWHIDSIINVGRISVPAQKSQLEKMHPRPKAALHLIDSIWRQLNEEVHVKGLQCLCPEFTILKAKEGQVKTSIWKWRSEFPRSGNPATVFVEPLSGYSMGQQIPDQDVMEHHNEIRQKESDFSLDGSLLRGYPLVWFPASEIMEWIKASRSKRNWIRVKKKNVAASAYVAIWETTLSNMANMNAKCIFLFKDCHVATVL